MFENLSFSEFTWKREPALWIALAVAILSVVSGAVSGTADWGTAIESIVVLVAGFLVRGQVSPTS